MILTSPEGRQHGLQLGENLIGRSADCALRADAPRVSRHHAKIEWDGQAARIMDLGSTNGTTINGRRIEPNRYYPLNSGDQLDFGAGPFALAEGMVPAAFASGSLGGFSLASNSLPGAVADLPYRAEEPTPRRLPWPVIAGLVGALALVFVVAVWWGLSRTRTEQAAQQIEPTAAPAIAVIATSTAAPASSSLSATATLAPQKAPVAPGAKAPAAPRPPAANASAPPIDSQTMPNMMQQFMAGVDPALLAGLSGGTSIPGLSDALGGTPGAPAQPRPGRYGPPRLVAPASGSGYSGNDAVVILEWEPTAGLGPNDYYWVMVFYKRGDREETGGAWMKGTSYRVPGWFLSQAEGRFEWQVVIAEATGLAEQGGKLRGAVSEPSERRWFTWSAGAPSEPPAPPPADAGNDPLPTPTYGG